ncbi:MAG: putative toxin-antitoxin system toxin component, PIN family [Betaproteobacteria bacterium RBG_19FT_COMBO_58_11]|nr:MAG: putative toxin-antitoxin system toxin component, PIN family [Betaproteobacteria bacterium RBG_19FT_COMBO_58_11]
MRVLLDTNVLIAAFIARGTCCDLLEYCVRNHTLVTSKPLLEEKLAGKFGYTRQETREVVSLLQGKMEVVAPAQLNPPVCRDPDDDVVLGTALASACDCTVTGDKDLLVLERFREIPILMPAGFWRHEKPGM